MLDPHKLAHDCIIDAPAPCSVACPVGVNVRDMMEHMRIGSYSAAYKAFAKSAVFPGIVSHICPRCCESACPRGEVDESIRLPELERFLWRESLGEQKKQFFIPDKKKRILVAGAGITGMSIASKLAQRGYHVLLAEKTDRLGGALWDLVEKGELPTEVLHDALVSLEDQKHVEILLNTEITGITDSYDAILICTGPGGPAATADEGSGIFVMGGARDPDIDFMACISEANEMFHVVESYIKVGRGAKAESKEPTVTFRPDMSNAKPVHTAIKKGTAYIDACEAKSEAERCLGCVCSNCVDSCEMLQHYRKNPKKTIMDLSDTINKTPLVQKTALRQIMSCTQCGLCSDVCPAGIDFKSVCLESREVLHSLGHLPDGLYDYWLRDMEFSNGGEAAVLLTPENPKDTQFVLFPGCQMGASDPEYVTTAYGWLEDAQRSNTALMVGCCGAPAYWAGDREMHESTVAQIRDTWEKLSRPVFILPCPTCLEMFSIHLPEIPAVSLWEHMADTVQQEPLNSRGQVSVFDPCSSKYNPSMQQAVRTILERLGYELVELEGSGRKSTCCGHGGLIYTTNPELYDKVRSDGANAGDRPYVTYCVNCRDNFAGEGKDAIHILDALFFGGEKRYGRTPPNLTERRESRRRLKNSLIKEHTDIGMDITGKRVELEVSAQLRELLDKRLIIDDNVIKVIKDCEESGRKVFNRETGHYTAHAVQGKVTFWVEYEPAREGVFRLHNAYTHRMVIEE